ncbi:group II intron reverse transcriptase/maturase [Methylobacter sp.]|uniref:group II intron reverse transcriptase/maturase n=1 Tax=Methylobacter sp. TaxID=2051955 RepID=UPI003DA6BBFC
MEPSHSPTREDADQRPDENPALNTNLLQQVLSNPNIRLAWQQVRQNKGAAGIDGISIEQFSDWIRPQWRTLREQLIKGDYYPQPVKRVRIPKDDGTDRLLGIPTVLDRVIQQAIVQVLSPQFDSTFSEHSHGFRPNRSAHDAVRQVQEYCQQKRRIAVDIDLSKFFDRVNHDLLMTLLGRRVRDKGLLQLVGRYLRASIMDGSNLLPCHEGVPQGGPLSPFLSNVMLDPLDKELEKRGHCFARYADDLIIMVKSQRAGERVLKSLTHFIENDLKLKVNTEKSQVVKSAQCKFLGFSFRGKYIRWHPKSVEKFKHRVRELTNRTWGVSMAAKIQRLSVYLRGWINYYGIGDQYQQCVDLDNWIRRRIRMCYWKQWRKPRTKIRNLIKLGVPKRAAISCGLSSKSYWRSSKSPGINMGLGLKYLKQQGLFSLREGWIAFHYG